MNKTLLIIGIILVVGFLIFKFGLKSSESDLKNTARPNDSNKPSVPVDNDKIVIVKNLKLDYLKQAIEQLCNMSNQDKYNVLPRLTILDKQFVITFPYDIEFDQFCYFVNYLKYAHDLSLKPDYKPDVKAWCTTKSGFAWMTDEIANKNVMLCPILRKPKMTIKNKIIYSTIITILLTGCFIGSGTHGSIKGYQYQIPKDSLQKAIMKVIADNPNIYRDTSLDYLDVSPLLGNADAINHSAGENYYNDIKHYVTIKITSEQEENQFTFRYYGDDEDWNKAQTSEIFICYINNDSEGNGGMTIKKAKKFIEVFEREFINKIDKKLNLTHKDRE